jgi:hypothetical protein
MRAVVKGCGLVAAGAITMFGVTIALNAEANYRRIAGMDCKGASAYSGKGQDILGTLTNNTGSVMEADCAFPEDSTLDKSGVADGGVWADLYFPATVTVPATVGACVYDCCSNSVVCGSGQTSGLGVGWQNPSPAMNAWGNTSYAGWYPHIEIINLPNNAQVNGVFYRD